MPRLRRFVLILLILPVVAILAGAVLVQMGAFDGWLAGRIVSEIETRTGGIVTLRDARLRLLPPRVALEGLSIALPSDPDPEPAIQLRSARVDLWTVNPLGVRRTLGRVAVDGLRLRIEEIPAGGLNILALRGQGSPTTGERPLFLRLGIGDLHLSDSTIVYHDRAFRVDSSGGGLSVDLRYEEQTVSYVGSFAMNGFELSVGNFSLPAVTLEAQVHYSEAGLRLDPLRFQATGIEADLGAVVQLQARPGYEVDVRSLRLDLPEIRILDPAGISEGRFEFTGRASGQGADFLFEGPGAAERIVVFGEPLESVTTAVAVNRNSVAVAELRWGYRGGRGEAGGTLYWERPAESLFEFSLSGVRVPPLLRQRGWSFPLPEGRAGARGTAAFPGLSVDEVLVVARGVLAGRVGTTDRPISIAAESDVRLTTASIELANAAVEAEGARLTGEGRLDYQGRVELSWGGEVSSGNRLVEIAEQAFGLVLPEPADQVQLPGASRFEGRLARQPGQPLELAGHFQPTEVGLPGGLEGDLTGLFGWSDDGLTVSDGRLAGAGFDVGFELQWPPGSPGPARVRLAFEGLPLPQAAAWLVPDLPLQSGRLSGPLDLTRETDRYSGEGRLRLAELRLYDQDLGTAVADVSFQGQAVQLQDLQLNSPSGTVSGRVGYDPASGDIDADLELRGIVLEQLETLPEGLGAAGRVNGRIDVNGVWPDLRGDVSLRSPEVALAGQRLTPFELSGRIARRQLDLTLGGRLLEQPLQGSGRVALTEPYPMSIRVDVDDIGIGPVWALAGQTAPPGVDGSLSGSLQASGPATRPSEWEVQFDLRQLRLSHEATALELASPTSLRLVDGRLRINGLELSGGTSRLLISGSVTPAETPEVQLQLSGDADLDILSAVLEQGRARGRLSVERLDLVGPINDPRLVGRATIEADSLIHPALPMVLGDITAELRFTSDQLSIEEFGASTRYGSFFATGGVFLDGFTPRRWQINAFGYGLTVEYPEGLSSRIDFDVDFSRGEQTSLLSGVVYVRAAEYLEDLSVADLVIMATQAQSRPVAAGGASDDETVLDLEVEAYRTIRINNNLADVIASGDFRLRGTVSRPVILGDIVIDEGRLRLDQNEYDVARGTIRFDDPGATHPVLDLEVGTQVREYDVTLLLRGPVEELRANVRSDPPLSTGEVVQLLATGEDPSEGSGLSRAGTLAVAGAGSLLSNTIGQQLGQTTRLFGFDRFSVDPFIDSGERDPGARVTLGKQITSELGVTYVTRLGGQLNRQAVIVQYRITDWLTGVGTGEEDGTVAIDFKIRKRF